MLNVDVDESVKPDLVCDILRLPYVSEASYIRCFDVLEHLDEEHIFKIHDMLEAGGVLHARVPYWSCRNSVNDFTHRRFFNINTFRNSIFKKLFTVRKLLVHYDFINHVIRFTLPLGLVNIHERLFPGLLPPSHIEIWLVKKTDEDTTTSETKKRP